MATTTWSRHDTDSMRQSFPVTVRESDSYGSLVDVTTVKRESLPPPVPSKPVTLQSHPTSIDSFNVHNSLKPTVDRAPAARSSTPWLDFMFQDDIEKDDRHSVLTAETKRRGPDLPPRPALSEPAASLPPPLPPPPLRTSIPTTFGTRLAQTNHQLKIKDRFATGVSIGKEWGGKGRGLLQEGWKIGSAAVSQATSSSTSSARLSPIPSSEPMTKSSSSSSSLDFVARSRSKGQSAINVFGVRVPATNPQLVFGLPLPVAVSNTSVKASSVVRPPDSNPVTGDDAARWLPRIAWRCLQYLEHNAKAEEGIYRVPGRANSVAQLRQLFDAGMDIDLREIHPGDLDPHAVALYSAVPDSLLSPQLERVVDEFSFKILGCSASVSQFLGSKVGSPSLAGGLVNGKACDEYVEQLAKWFAEQLEAEYFHLLRALSYHLFNLSTYSATNKMGLANLRLILSPTLRLSPVFLAILVEERDKLFSGPNQSARDRKLPAEEMLRSKNEAHSSGFVSLSMDNVDQALPRSSPDTSDSKLDVQDCLVPAAEPTASPSTAASFATPIADKFSSTFATSPTLPAPSHVSSARPFIPSRSAEPNALFVNRAGAPGSAKTSPRLRANGGANEQVIVDSLQGLGIGPDTASRRLNSEGDVGVKHSAIPLLPDVSSIDESKTESWSFLSIEERRKLFGG
ncbi:hypothetical protein OIV83_003149 [Microbotryomycetes sp. JL201]|nr:hypothetical protein OIV83_003149 [Microbotryomycetes sp. JL201]